MQWMFNFYVVRFKVKGTTLGSLKLRISYDVKITHAIDSYCFKGKIHTFKYFDYFVLCVFNMGMKT